MKLRGHLLVLLQLRLVSPGLDVVLNELLALGEVAQPVHDGLFFLFEVFRHGL